jgi:signal transduction histidine kinase
VQLERRKRAVAFHVRDDGAGFDPRTAAGGQGLTNLRDRLAALGGHAGIESAVGRGTIVSGRIPLP